MSPGELTAPAAPSSLDANHPEMRRLRAQGEQLDKRLAELPTIRTEQDLATVGAVRELIVAAEDKVHFWTDPVCEAAHKAHKAATAMRAGMLAPLAALKARADNLIRDYRLRQERAREAVAAKELRALEAAQAADPGTALELPAPPPPVSRVAGATVKLRYAFEVLNVDALARVYLMPDEQRIRAMVNAHGPDAAKLVTAPGQAMAIRVWRADVVASRRDA
jgi:hypothetical protein